MQKELILNSVWEQLSNRVEVTQPVPNSKGMDMVPDSVVINVSDDFSPGVRQTTVPFINKLNQKGQGGRQKADGNEETPSLKYKAVRYNVQRKSVALEEESVDGDLNKFYKIGNMGKTLLTDYFVELTDYNHTRGVMEAADEFLTESVYWDGSSVTTNPAVKAHHPNWYANGKSAVATYSTVYATHETNIDNYLDTLTSATNPFDLQALDALVKLASQSLIPLKWSAGGKKINWVFLLSETQIQELTDSTTSNSWSVIMRDADVRGDLNRSINGIVGNYRGALVIANPRSPLWDTTAAATAGARIGYVKPWSNGQRYNGLDVAVPPTAKTAADSGTIEIAMCFGRGALGSAKIKDLKFDEEKKDYNFYKGLCGMRAEGQERMDFDITTPTATSKKNQTSLVYGTPTPATVY
jgi:hypothetical protein